jgi:transcriptional regulator with XRE-family HTH domain
VYFSSRGYFLRELRQRPKKSGERMTKIGKLHKVWMKTTRRTVARLESGRGQPSTRTLLRFAKATGHRLKISFQPMKGKG